MAKLTAKQKRFCEEYLIDLNATQAAIRAGYSPHTANEQGNRLLTNVSVRSYVDKAIAERSRRTGINADRVIIELAKIALVNPKNVIDFTKAGVKHDAPDEDLAAVQSVKVKEMNTNKGDSIEREVRLYDKTKALELLGKHLGMFKDNVNVNANVNSTKKLDAILEEMNKSDD